MNTNTAYMYVVTLRLSLTLSRYSSSRLLGAMYKKYIRIV